MKKNQLTGGAKTTKCFFFQEELKQLYIKKPFTWIFGSAACMMEIPEFNTGL
jgi:hypothetical protein